MPVFSACGKLKWQADSDERVIQQPMNQMNPLILVTVSDFSIPESIACAGRGKNTQFDNLVKSAVYQRSPVQGVR